MEEQKQGSDDMPSLSSKAKNGNRKINLERFYNAEFDLYDLDEPDDELVVTVVVMVGKRSDRKVYTLYKLIAGMIVETPEVREENLRVVTVFLNNNLLHQQIERHCLSFFLDAVGSDKRHRWEQDSPYFIVTSRAPQYGRNGCSILVDPIICKDVSTDAGRVFYDFEHPCNPDMCFRIYEPASPPDVKAIFSPNPGGQKSESGQVPGYSMKRAENKRMHPDIQRMLMAEQKKIIYSLRKYHQRAGATRDAVTAIIATSIMDGHRKVGVLLVNGILTGNQRILDGNDQDGAIVNLAWLYSEELANRTRDGCRSHQTLYVRVVSEGLGERASRHGLTILKEDGSGQFGGVQVRLVHESGPQLPRFEVKFMQKTGTYQYVPEQNLGVSANFNNVPIEEHLHSLNQILPEPQGRVSEENEEELVISINEVVSPSHHGRISFELKRDVFILLAKGNQNDITLPTLFTYHDPLNSWKCKTWMQRNSDWLSLIHNYKLQPSNEKSSVAEHILIHISPPHIDGHIPQRTTILEMVYKEGFRVKKKTLPLDIWSHDRNDNSLKHELSPNGCFQAWKRSLNRQSVEAFEEQVRDGFPVSLQDLPQSFKHPTIQLSLKYVPGPNQMGILCPTDHNESCDHLYSSHDDEAHIKFVNSSVYADTETQKEQLLKRIIELIRDDQL